ncbi:hypothetical protein QWJ07_26090 [Frankia sp. RB7]|nr:hypothetical protein [Frankia sp. RB7]
MAPVICVAVSQPLGRTILNSGSRSGNIGSSLGFAGTLEIGCEIDVHFVGDATAEI